MIVSENGLLKGCKGRIGKYVIYECRGKTCIRRVPGKEKILLTPEMLKQQERMAGVAALYQAVKSAGVLPGWKDAAREMQWTGYNLFVKLNQRVFGGTGKVGRFEELTLTVGDLENPSRLEVRRMDAEQVEVTWQEEVELPRGCRGDDRLRAVLLREGEEGLEMAIPEIGDWQRKHCRAVIRLPTKEGKSYEHLFCYFCSADGKRFSRSRYFYMNI